MILFSMSYGWGWGVCFFFSPMVSFNFVLIFLICWLPFILQYWKRILYFFLLLCLVICWLLNIYSLVHLCHHLMSHLFMDLLNCLMIHSFFVVFALFFISLHIYRERVENNKINQKLLVVKQMLPFGTFLWKVNFASEFPVYIFFITCGCMWW